MLSVLDPNAKMTKDIKITSKSAIVLVRPSERVAL